MMTFFFYTAEELKYNLIRWSFNLLTSHSFGIFYYKSNSIPPSSKKSVQPRDMDPKIDQVAR